MKVLVTGGTGFIGSHLIKALKDQHQVYTISRKVHPPNLIDVKVLKGNLCNEMFMRYVMNYVNPDLIFHLAANPNVKLDDLRPTSIIYDNVVSTQNICHYAPKNCRILYASSVVAYGDNSFKMDETLTCRPTSVYGATKLASEGIIHAYHSQGHIRGTSLRLCATVGAGLTHGIIYDFIRKLRSDSDYLEVIGDFPGSQKPFAHVDDVVSAFLLMANEDVDSVYNVVPDNMCTVNEVAHAVMDALDIQKEIKWLGSGANWAGDNKKLWCDNNRIKYRGWIPKFLDSREAIKQAVKDVVKMGG